MATGMLSEEEMMERMRNMAAEDSRANATRNVNRGARTGRVRTSRQPIQEGERVANHDTLHYGDYVEYPNPTRSPLVFQKRINKTKNSMTLGDPSGRTIDYNMQIRVVGIPRGFGIHDNYQNHVKSTEEVGVSDLEQEAKAIEALDLWAEDIKEMVLERYEQQS